MNVRSQGPRRQRREFQVDTVFLVVKKPEIYIFFISKKPGNGRKCKYFQTSVKANAVRARRVGTQKVKNMLSVLTDS